MSTAEDVAALARGYLNARVDLLDRTAGFVGDHPYDEVERAYRAGYERGRKAALADLSSDIIKSWITTSGNLEIEGMSRDAAMTAAGPIPVRSTPDTKPAE